MDHTLHSQTRVRALAGALCAIATSFVASTAFAHHDMDGKTPATLFEGLVSGLAHPVIGLDHLAMVLLVGAFCGAMRLGYAPIAAFLGATFVGCLIHVAQLDLLHAEKVLAASLVIAGMIACAITRAPRLLTAVMFAACGVFHGYAYGESVVGAEATPLLAYLAGFFLVQLALAAGSARMAAHLAHAASGSRPMLALRVLGAASVVVGAVALA